MKKLNKFTAGGVIACIALEKQNKKIKSMPAIANITINNDRKT